jgi:hypothetical protein
MNNSKPPRADYWADRFRQAETDPDEARSLLVLFAELAEHPKSDDGEAQPTGNPAEGADSMLVQWVAQRVKAWTDAGFAREKAQRAFGIAKKRGRPLTNEAMKFGLQELHAQRVAAVGHVLRLTRTGGLTLEKAAEEAAKLVAIGSKGPTVDQVLQEYEQRRRMPVADWMPLIIAMDGSARAEAAKRARPGPRRKVPKP